MGAEKSGRSLTGPKRKGGQFDFNIGDQATQVDKTGKASVTSTKGPPLGPEGSGLPRTNKYTINPEATEQAGPEHTKPGRELALRKKLAKEGKRELTPEQIQKLLFHRAEYMRAQESERLRTSSPKFKAARKALNDSVDSKPKYNLRPPDVIAELEAGVKARIYKKQAKTEWWDIIYDAYVLLLENDGMKPDDAAAKAAWRWNNQENRHLKQISLSAENEDGVDFILNFASAAVEERRRQADDCGEFERWYKARTFADSPDYKWMIRYFADKHKKGHRHSTKDNRKAELIMRKLRRKLKVDLV
jgi:hypothetical protein